MRTRLLAAIAAVGLILPASGSAGPQTPRVVDLPDTPLSSPNVHLVTTLHTGSAVGGKFARIDGKLYYFQTTVRPGFYLPSGIGGGGVVVLDVSSPEQPLVVGALPLPVSQNEDVEVSAKRKILLYSMDSRRVFSAPAVNACGRATADQDRAVLCRRLGGALFVIDVSIPNAPRIRSVLAYPNTVGFRADGMPLGGPGHTATCVMGCKYAYVSGSRDRGVHVVDLRDLDNPKIVGRIASPAGAEANGWNPGIIHDAYEDQFGNLWMAGSGGTAMYAPITDPLRPKLVAVVSPGDNKATNQLIHHGVVRFDKSTVLIGEEQFGANPADACGKPDAGRGDYDKNGADDEDGSLQVWKIDLVTKRLLVQDTWDTELEDGTLPKYLNDSVGIGCSSHWFDSNANKIVADGWYEQGLRFLDISNQRRIRQVGYWIGPATAASQAQFVPGRSDLVYVADYSRGLDVVRIDRGGKGAATVTAPLRAEWFGRDPLTPRMEPDETYGYMCRRPFLG